MKNIFKIVTVFIYLFVCQNSYGQTTLPLKVISKMSCELCDTIAHENHEIYFSKTYNVPALVEYSLSPEISNNFHNYKFHFVEDANYQYNLNNSLSKYYRKTGFDRGHLYPAEDASYSKLTFMESYYETNMTPQYVKFNRGIWKRLETKIRKLAKTNTIDVITGPDLYNETLSKLSNKVSIPKYYFKIIINYDKSTIDIYYIPNLNIKNSNVLSKYLIGVNDLYIKCGILLNLEFINKFKYMK